MYVFQPDKYMNMYMYKEKMKWDWSMVSVHVQLWNIIFLIVQFYIKQNAKNMHC